jgi:hypothetical protein
VIVISFGIVIALAAAARSTWSPCGLSMLSQITPMAESGRGHKFASTARWFVIGATLGGITLGCAIAAGALAVAGAGVSTNAAVAATAGLALIGAAVDAHLFGFGPPFLRRQVNQDWLANYRSWVYGGGFGWQIGVGLTTYVMTAAVPLTIAVGALTGNPAAALTIGTIFGLARGLAVLLGGRVRTPTALIAFHRRFEALGEPVRQAVIAVQLTVAVVAALLVAPLVVGAAIGLVAIALFLWSGARDRDAEIALQLRAVPK